MTDTDGASAILDLAADAIRMRSALVVPPSRYPELQGALAKVAAGLAVTAAEFVQRASENHALVDALIDEVAVGETYFFREAGQFAFVRSTVIPDVRARLGGAHVFKAWSAGCASGEEPYSLAIILEEEGFADCSKIVASDISATSLSKARMATYAAWSLRGEGERLVGRYLMRRGNRFELAERLRRRVQFVRLNLARDPYPPGGFDLILCRNVLLYFHPDALEPVVRRLYAALSPGGYLITGPSDPLLHLPFEVLTTPSGLIYRRNADVCDGAPSSWPLHAPDLGPASLPGAMEQSPSVHARRAPSPRDEAEVYSASSTPDPADSPLARARALAAKGDIEGALALTQAASERQASPELGFLSAILLTNLGRYREAERVLRGVLYLDGSLAVAHFARGAVLHRLGDTTGALRAYRNAQELSVRLEPEHIVALSDGESAARLAKAAATQIGILETGGKELSVAYS